MKTLIVYAHPEPTSLNGSLKDLAVSTLESAGHEVQVSDLYAMNWKAVVDASDYGPHAARRLRVARDSGRAFDAGTLTPDVRPSRRSSCGPTRSSSSSRCGGTRCPRSSRAGWTGCSPTTSPKASASTATPGTATASVKAPSPAGRPSCQ